jgi:hypothetical protein
MVVTSLSVGKFADNLKWTRRSPEASGTHHPVSQKKVGLKARLRKLEYLHILQLVSTVTILFVTHFVSSLEEKSV